MKIEKTESGWNIIFYSNGVSIIKCLSPSDYLQLRDHFAKEIVEGLTDEMIGKRFPIPKGMNNSERGRDKARHRIDGAKWLRSQITGSK